MRRKTGDINKSIAIAVIGETLISIGIILSVLLCIAGLGLWWTVNSVQKYHDENTFADLCVTVTKERCQENFDNLGEFEIVTDDPDEFENGLLMTTQTKGTYVKGNRFTVGEFEFEVESVEHKDSGYVVLKLIKGNLICGEKEYIKGEVFTIYEGESISFMIPETEYAGPIIIKLDKVWWY